MCYLSSEVFAADLWPGGVFDCHPLYSLAGRLLQVDDSRHHPQLKDVHAYGLRAEVCLSYACARPEEICLNPSAAEGPFGQRRAPPGDSPLDRMERGGSKLCHCEYAVRLELLGVNEGVHDFLA